MTLIPGQEEIKKAGCAFCAGNCGVLVHVKDGKVAWVEGNQEHRTKGCPAS